MTDKKLYVFTIIHIRNLSYFLQNSGGEEIMGYCFMGIEKVKTKGAMTRKYNHNYRIEPTHNVILENAHLNDELIPMHGKTYNEKKKKKMKALGYGQEQENGQTKQIRKNAVLGLEVLLTFSREDFENVDIEKWKKDNVKWLRETFNANPEKYGDNVISAQFHGDEVGNVHIHAFIIPIDDKGKLNASYYINGRKQLSMLQSSYGKVMQENHNLKRGLKGSQASHNDIKHFYASLNQKVEMEPPQYKDNESLEDYYKRVKESYRVLNEQILALELKYQRKYDEFKTLNINEAIEYERLKEERKTYDKILDKFGSLDFAWNRLETISDLNEGLKNYPDREYAKKAQKMIKTLISYQESEARDIQIDDKEDHQI